MRQQEQGKPIIDGNTVISLNKYAFPYNGKAQKPSVTVKYRSKKLKAGTDYEIDYSAIGAPENAVEKKNADTYRISLTFKGNYTGSASLCYAITPVETSKLKVSVPAQKYNGEAICPDLSEMTVKLGSVKLDAQALHGLTL